MEAIKGLGGSSAQRVGQEVEQPLWVALVGLFG